MSEQYYKRLEELSGQLRKATALLTPSSDPTTGDPREFCIAHNGLYSWWPALSLTYDEVKTIAQWKISALEEELALLQSKKP